MFCKRGVLGNFIKFTGKHLCQSLVFNNVAGLRPQACNFIKKETLAQVFSCEFCNISKNTFSYRTPLVTASRPSFFCLSTQKHNKNLALLIITTSCVSQTLFLSNVCLDNVSSGVLVCHAMPICIFSIKNVNIGNHLYKLKFAQFQFSSL